MQKRANCLSRVNAPACSYLERLDIEHGLVGRVAGELDHAAPDLVRNRGSGKPGA